MTTRRKFVIVAVAILIAFGLVTSLFLRRVEPVYQDKPLSAWARQFGSNNWTANRVAAREAQAAIRAIGPKATPFFVKWMWAEESAMKKRLRERLPQRWHDTLHLKDRAGEIRRMGAHGIAALGTNAPPEIVPQLIEIGERHPDEDGRYIAVFALRNLGPVAEPAIPFFLRCLANAESIIREEGAVGLGMVGRQPDVAVPGLIKYLEIARNLPNSFEARGAVYALRKFGTNARPAVPLLLSLRDHPRDDVREAVTNSLLIIDLDAATQAGLRHLR